MFSGGRGGGFFEQGGRPQSVMYQVEVTLDDIYTGCSRQASQRHRAGPKAASWPET
jgi:hypothetical protein